MCIEVPGEVCPWGGPGSLEAVPGAETAVEKGVHDRVKRGLHYLANTCSNALQIGRHPIGAPYWAGFRGAGDGLRGQGGARGSASGMARGPLRRPAPRRSVRSPENLVRQELGVHPPAARQGLHTRGPHAAGDRHPHSLALLDESLPRGGLSSPDRRSRPDHRGLTSRVAPLWWRPFGEIPYRMLSSKAPLLV
jgi:hypothetical protein